MMLKSYKTLLYGILVALCSLSTIMVATGVSRDLNELLLVAVQQNQIEEVKKLLRDGADINAQNKHDDTPLHLAVYSGVKEVVELLLEHGANVNVQNEDGDMPLHNAAYKGHKEVVALLLEHGADVNVQNEDGDMPLHRAASVGNKEIVALLLEHGADVNVQNKDGVTSSYYIVELLLEHGADVDAQNEDGLTPLYYAAFVGNKEMVKLLLEHGADVNVQDRAGLTPLYYAASIGNKEMVELLLEHGADVNVQNKNGVTLLYCAASMGNKEMVELLLEHGADVNVQNKDGVTPLHCAASMGNKEIVALLLVRGAVIKPNVNYAGTLSLFEQKIVKGDSKYIERKLSGSECEESAGKKPLDEVTRGLLIAVGQGRVEIVNLLLEYLVQNKSLGQEIVTEMQHALYAILRSRDLSPERRQSYQEILKKLFELVKDASVPQQGLTVAQKMNLPKEIEIALFNFLVHEVNTPSGKLVYAALTNNVQAAREALKEGAYVNAQDLSGRTALHYFAYHGDSAGVDLLIGSGADRDIRDVFGDSAAAHARSFVVAYLKRLERGGATQEQIEQERILGEEFVRSVMSSPQQLLFLGSQKGNINLIKRVLEQGARVRVAASGDHNRTPLHYAVTSGDQEIIKLLLENGAEVNGQDSEGRTPLHYLAAARLSSETAQAIANLLLEHGANLEVRDREGDMPSQLAMHEGRYWLATVLRAESIFRPPQTGLSRIVGLFTGSGS